MGSGQWKGRGHRSGQSQGKGRGKGGTVGSRNSNSPTHQGEEIGVAIFKACPVCLRVRGHHRPIFDAGLVSIHTLWISHRVNLQITTITPLDLQYNGGEEMVDVPTMLPLADVKGPILRPHISPRCIPCLKSPRGSGNSKRSDIY